MKVQIAPDFRDLFRPLTDSELEHAKENNRSDPNHERVPPIAVWQCDKECILVDGHHTHKIRENLRVDGRPVKIRYHKMDFPDRQAAMAYAIRAQAGRRNLDASQLSIALAKLPKTAPARSPGGQLATRSKPAENGQNTREAIAAEAGIGRKTLQRADKVNELGAKAINDAVAKGDVSVSDAAAIADLPKSEQVAALKKVKQGEAKTLKVAAAPKKRKPAKGKQKPSAATIFTAMQQKHFSGQSGLPQQLEAMAKANGGKGEQYKIAKNCLDEFLKATKQMRGGTK